MENNTKEKVQNSIDLVKKFKNINTEILINDDIRIQARYDSFKNKLTIDEKDKITIQETLAKNNYQENLFVQLNISEGNTVIVSEGFTKSVEKLSKDSFQLISDIYMNYMDIAFRQQNNNSNIKVMKP